MNGKPVLRFDNDFLIAEIGQIPQPVTAFVVWNKNNTTAGLAWDGIQQEFYFGSLSIPPVSMTMRSGIFLSQPYDSPFDYVLNSCVYNTSNSKLYSNGILGASGNVGSNILDGLRIGSRRNNSWWLVGDIAEIIFYNSLLSDPQRQSVENYLMAKYAL